MNEITREIKRRGRWLELAANKGELSAVDVAEAIFECTQAASNISCAFINQYLAFDAPARVFGQAVNVTRVCARNLLVMTQADAASKNDGRGTKPKRSTVQDE